MDELDLISQVLCHFDLPDAEVYPAMAALRDALQADEDVEAATHELESRFPTCAVNPDGGTYRLVANTALVLGAWTLVLGGLSFIAWLSQSDALRTESAPKDDLPEIGF